MEAYIDVQDAVTTITNYKDIFQKYCQRMFGCTPTYTMLSPGPDPKEIRVLVMEGPSIHGRGMSTTRKKAEQMAAKEALEKFNAMPSA